MDNKKLGILSSIWLTVLFCFFYLSSSAFGGIVAKPGTFDHFQIDSPDTVIAGSEYKITILAVDAFGNAVTMPADSIKEYKLKVTGSATITPVSFKSNEITQTGFQIKFRDEKAEEVLLSLYEANRPFPIVEKRIKIMPNQISSLEIKVPSSAKVGQDFDIFIVGKDRYHNTVCKDFDPQELNIFFKGDVAPNIRQVQYISDGCNFRVKLYSEKMGSFYIEANLLDRNISGKSEKVEVLNADVSSFIVTAPSEAVVGEPFEVTILAIDKFNNFVKDFASKKEKLIIEAQGKGYIFPSEISSYAFSNGKAKISLRYDRLEDIKVIVKVANNPSIRGESETIKITPPVVKNFEVISPDTVIAGQKFKIKIVAYNQNNKVMSNYNIYGKNVLLKSTGTGTITPNKIPPSEFINGIAIVEVMYDKAEQFEIIATTEEVQALETKIKEEKKPEKPKKEKKTKKEPQKTKNKITAIKLLELKNISQVETKNTCSLTLFIPDFGKRGGYSAVTKKSGKTMSVVVEVHPVLNKIESPVNIESAFIKEVKVSEEKNKVILNIILKKPLKYRFYKKKDEVVIEFRRA